MPSSPAIHLVAQEARALLTRLWRVKPYALNMPMVSAATVAPRAQAAIEMHMSVGKQRLEAMMREFLAELEASDASTRPAEVQRKFAALRMRFNAVLTQFDIFADVLVQRSEHGTGVWIAGLDDLAADALSIVGPYAELPPVICYLYRGIGAAIRRARTRLPGGDVNPVGIIRIPRERMVGSGIASSLVHEAGHQGAEVLGLVSSLRQVLIERQSQHSEQPAWRLWERWISEIVADVWSLGLLGLTATQGLLAVVSLPRPFVFRIAEDDPHPFPWFRVKIGCAIGNALYPDSQWARLARIWEELYPPGGLDERRRAVIRGLEATLPEFVETLLDHRPESLGGRRLRDLFPLSERTPVRLRAYMQEARRDPALLRRIPPTLAFAILGQARAEDMITPEQEGDALAHLLTHWAVRSSLDTSILCASTSAPFAGAARLAS